MALSPKTYVFLDLEATGLFNYLSKRPCITELALIAVRVSDLQSNDIKNIRIVHKILLCIKPKHQIEPQASQISGLFNHDLSTTNTFDKNTATQVKWFLDRLEKPICLVAHNGVGYDFPLLILDMLDGGESLPADLLYLDTLQLLRNVCVRRNMRYELLSVNRGCKRKMYEGSNDTPVKRTQGKVVRKLFPHEPSSSRQSQQNQQPLATRIDDACKELTDSDQLLLQDCGMIERGLVGEDDISTDDEETVSKEQCFGSWATPGRSTVGDSCSGGVQCVDMWPEDDISDADLVAACERMEQDAASGRGCIPGYWGYGLDAVLPEVDGPANCTTDCGDNHNTTLFVPKDSAAGTPNNRRISNNTPSTSGYGSGDVTTPATQHIFTDLKLGTIYHAIFNKDFEAHNAEADAYALLAVCHALWNTIESKVDSFSLSYENMKSKMHANPKFHISKLDTVT